MIITGVGDKKIQVIKEVRAITSLGLKEAKDAVETLPNTIKEGVSQRRSRKVKKQLEEAGATSKLNNSVAGGDLAGPASKVKLVT